MRNPDDPQTPTWMPTVRAEEPHVWTPPVLNLALRRVGQQLSRGGMPVNKTSMLRSRRLVQLRYKGVRE